MIRLWEVPVTDDEAEDHLEYTSSSSNSKSRPLKRLVRGSERDSRQRDLSVLSTTPCAKRPILETGSDTTHDAMSRQNSCTRELWLEGVGNWTFLRYQTSDGPKPSKKELQQFLGWTSTFQVEDLIHHKQTIQLLGYLAGLKLKHHYQRIPNINRDIERCANSRDLWGAKFEDMFFNEYQDVALSFAQNIKYSEFRVHPYLNLPYTSIEKIWLVTKFASIAGQYHSNVAPLEWNSTDKEPITPETPTLRKSSRTIRLKNGIEISSEPKTIHISGPLMNSHKRTPDRISSTRKVTSDKVVSNSSRSPVNGGWSDTRSARTLPKPATKRRRVTLSNDLPEIHRSNDPQQATGILSNSLHAEISTPITISIMWLNFDLFDNATSVQVLYSHDKIMLSNIVVWLENTFVLNEFKQELLTLWMVEPFKVELNETRWNCVKREHVTFIFEFTTRGKT